VDVPAESVRSAVVQAVGNADRTSAPAFLETTCHRAASPLSVGTSMVVATEPRSALRRFLTGSLRRGALSASRLYVRLA